MRRAESARRAIVPTPNGSVSMGVARVITRFIDWFYIAPLRRWVPRETFRYAMCGGLNLLLMWMLYYLIYRFLVAGHYLNLGFVVMSPHVLTLCIQFPITFFTGFWLNRYVTFTLSPLRGRTQLVRYVLQTAGSFLLNYLLLKLFVEVCHLYAPVAKPVVDAVVILYSYLAARFFTFRTHRAHRTR